METRERSPLSLLTPRELACLRLVSLHLTSKAIAKQLGISPYTVDKHLREALQKLAVPTRREAAILLARLESPPSVEGGGFKAIAATQAPRSAPRSKGGRQAIRQADGRGAAPGSGGPRGLAVAGLDRGAGGFLHDLDPARTLGLAAAVGLGAALIFTGALLAARLALEAVARLL